MKFDNKNGASDGVRTHDNDVGNVMLYQLSYTRKLPRAPVSYSGPPTAEGVQAHTTSRTNSKFTSKPYSCLHLCEMYCSL